MQLDDYTSRGQLRRWDLLDGQPRCPLNPVDPARISDADRAAILAQNATVRAKVEAVEAYEAANRLRAGEPPERYEEVVEEEGGEPVRRETAAYKLWRDAGKVVDDATAETLALAAIRAGAPVIVDGKEVEREPDPIPEDTIVLLQPVPQEVTETQFIRACVRAGIITAAEGVAYLARGELPAMMETALEILPEAARTDATLKAIGSASFSRTDGVFDALVASEVATAAQIVDVFRLAATLG
jgi:hypothetical protein